MTSESKIVEIHNVTSNENLDLFEDFSDPIKLEETEKSPIPEKIIIVIDPISKPMEAINGGIDLVVEGGKAIGKGFENMGKSMKKWFHK